MTPGQTVVEETVASWVSFDDIEFDAITASITMNRRELSNPFIRCKSDDSTLLHYFAKVDDCAELLAFLVEAGIPVDAIDNCGLTPLHEAAQAGLLSNCKALLKLQAKPNVMCNAHSTPLLAAIKAEKPVVAHWLLNYPDAWDQRWDNTLFESLLQYTPSIVVSFMDKFATERGTGDNGAPVFWFKDIRLIYGQPDVAMDQTALAIAARLHKKKNVLWHPIMEYVAFVKWASYGEFEFYKEFLAYFVLLLLYYITTIWAHPNWNSLKDKTDILVLVLRVIAWVLCGHLLVNVEFKEFYGHRWKNYFKSFWNWITLIAYGTILVTIPLEFIGGSTDSARRSLLALIMVTLSLNMLQYLQIFKSTGLLIVMMGDMIRDVTQFFWFYSVFLMGFSAAFYLLFQGAAGYENFVSSFITVLLMLFGQVTYDPFRDAQGWIWHMGNLLLLIYLVTVVVMLLNILIAMMSATYSLDSSAATDRVAVCCAEIILRFEISLSEAERKRKYFSLLPSEDATQFDATAAVANTDNVLVVDVEDKVKASEGKIRRKSMNPLKQLRTNASNLVTASKLPTAKVQVLDELKSPEVDKDAIRTTAVIKSANLLEMRAHKRQKKELAFLKDGLHCLEDWERREEAPPTAEITAKLDQLTALLTGTIEDFKTKQQRCNCTPSKEN